MAESTRSLSLRNRLLFGLLVPLLALLTLSGFVSYRIALSYANSVYDGWLYDSANSLAEALESTANGTRLDLPVSARRLFEWDVEDKTSYKVTSSRTGLISGRADLPALPADGEAYRDARLYEADLDGARVRVVAVSLQRTPGETIEVQVAETERKRHDLARQILLSSLVPQLLLILAAAAVVWFGVRAGLAPLRAIATSIGERSHRSLQRIPEGRAPAEVRSLIHALNELLDRLDQTLSAQRAFVADAAHQLRTPVTTLLLQVEAAAGTADAGEREREFDRLRVSIKRLVRLSNQLLSLARTEPDAADARGMEVLDLCELARDTGAEWVPQALAKGLDLGFEADADRTLVRGNPVLLREVLNNLLDNAIKHHPGKGRVTLTVHGAPAPHLTVEDDGLGIAPQDRDVVFRRFHRGDRNRSEGAGLGLAIVHEIATLHGGTVVLGDAAGGHGLRVEVRLPAAPAPG
jgi:two-component system sensor histidine kinase TctE